jgi:hypothetical protein
MSLGLDQELTFLSLSLKYEKNTSAILHGFSSLVMCLLFYLCKAAKRRPICCLWELEESKLTNASVNYALENECTMHWDESSF